jgi:hypothetical protein
MMKMGVENKRFALAGSVIAIALILLGILYLFSSKNEKKITNYEECVAAGGIILESFPPQCQTKGGTSFTMQVNAETPDTGTEIPFTVVTEGQNTGTKFDGMMYPIGTKEEWDNMWIGINPSLKGGPEFDFNANTAIGLFLEQQSTGGYGIDVTKITESNRIIVYVVNKSPGLGCMTTEALTAPYKVLKIEKTKKPIIFKTEQKIVNCFS